LPDEKAQVSPKALLRVSVLSKTGTNSNGNAQEEHLPLDVGVFGLKLFIIN
jgi:hypothetical protein|tara:strand:+ start:1371 stop:1523 length:153 start_codon:yes stop_codon:yes gene_type:complete